MAIQRFVNEAVEKLGVPTVVTGSGAATATVTATGAGTTIPTGTATGTVTVTGTAVGYAPALTPKHVETLRGFLAQIRAGTVVVGGAAGAMADRLDVLEGLLSLAERVVDLLP